MDKLTPDRRSANMSAIRSKDSDPEMAVRRAAHRLGYRFRLHRRDLPGKPDLVFPRLRKVIFVHGCFWHLHPGCREGRVPGSNQSYWEPKLRGNVERDRKRQDELRAQGWDVLVVWECETKNVDHVEEILRDFLDSAPIPSAARGRAAR